MVYFLWSLLKAEATRSSISWHCPFLWTRLRNWVWKLSAKVRCVRFYLQHRHSMYSILPTETPGKPSSLMLPFTKLSVSTGVAWDLARVFTVRDLPAFWHPSCVGAEGEGASLGIFFYSSLCSPCPGLFTQGRAEPWVFSRRSHKVFRNCFRVILTVVS